MDSIENIINNKETHLIDVRTQEEVAEVSVPNAENIPLDTITQHVEKINELSQTGNVVLFCRSGARSGRALEFLKQQGINRVYNGGGYADVLRMKQ